MLLQAFDQIGALSSSFDVMDSTKLEKLFTLKGTQGRGVEEDLGRRGRCRHCDRMVREGEDERV